MTYRFSASISDPDPSAWPRLAGVTMNTHDFTHFLYRSAPVRSSALNRGDRPMSGTAKTVRAQRVSRKRFMAVESPAGRLRGDNPWASGPGGHRQGLRRKRNMGRINAYYQHSRPARSTAVRGFRP